MEPGLKTTRPLSLGGLLEETPLRLVLPCRLVSGYEKGHWLSLYRDRFMGPKPPVQMRTQTRGKPEGAVLPADAPSSRAMPPGFFLRLLISRHVQ